MEYRDCFRSRLESLVKSQGSSGFCSLIQIKFYLFLTRNKPKLLAGWVWILTTFTNSHIPLVGWEVMGHDQTAISVAGLNWPSASHTNSSLRGEWMGRNQSHSHLRGEWDGMDPNLTCLPQPSTPQTDQKSSLLLT